LSEAVSAAKPEVVFHLAAQPLVKDSYSYPIETYSTNVMGTVNLLEAVRSTASVRAVVNITTDKVYENREWVWGYRETDALGGFDPYSNSKACSELVTSAYRDSFFNEKNYQNHQVAIATARSGNVIGGGDWAANRLLPDCISAFQSNKKVILRYPNSVRPWQHVLDTLNGYLMLARKLFEEGSQFGGGWNFSPDPADGKTVSWIVDAAARLWGQNSGYIAVPTESAHETGLLMLDSSKSRYALGWKPRWHIEYALSHTVGWFKSFHAGENAYQLCRSQIALFEDSI
jgi:CDP-glucose 4,6-dehydratase